MQEVGQTEAITLWKTQNGDVIVDGYTRYPILKELNLSIKVIYKDFKDEHEVMEYIIDYQLLKKNPSKYDTCLAVLALEPGLKIKARENQKLGGQITGQKNGKLFSLENIASIEKIDTWDIMAKKAKVSKNFIRAVKLIRNNATEQEKEDLRDDKITVSELAELIRERINQVKEEFKSITIPSDSTGVFEPINLKKSVDETNFVEAIDEDITDISADNISDANEIQIEKQESEPERSETEAEFENYFNKQRFDSKLQTKQKPIDISKKMSKGEILKLTLVWVNRNNSGWYHPDHSEEQTEKLKETYGKQNKIGILNFFRDSISIYRKKIKEKNK